MSVPVCFMVTSLILICFIIKLLEKKKSLRSD